MTIFETYHSSFRAFNCFFQLNHDMGRRVCGWMFLQKVSTIETKQAAVKNLGADDTGVLGGFDSGPFWESPETQPTIGIFSDGATSCYFFRCLSEFSDGFFHLGEKVHRLFSFQAWFLVLKFYGICICWTANVQHSRHLLGVFLLLNWGVRVIFGSPVILRLDPLGYLGWE